MSNGKGRVVLITGASSGIGLAAAREFVKNGDTVYSLSRTAPPDGAAVGFIKTDVTSEAEVQAAVDAVLAGQHRIDVLVLNAGFGISGAVEFTAEEDAKRQLDVCFFGAFRAVKAALPALRASKGAMLFVGSVAGGIPIPFQTFYSAAKAAVNALVLGLRGELRGTGVRVAALLPGDVKTGFTAVREKCEAGAALYPAMGRSIASMERSEQSGMDPARIGKKLVKLSKQRRPKPFCTVGFVYKAFLVLAKVLPARLVSCIVGLIYAN